VPQAERTTCSSAPRPSSAGSATRTSGRRSLGILKDKLQYPSLLKDSELREQLIGPEFTLNSRDEILLEPKGFR
jgi:hypothetical protein